MQLKLMIVYLAKISKIEHLIPQIKLVIVMILTIL